MRLTLSLLFYPELVRFACLAVGSGPTFPEAHPRSSLTCSSRSYSCCRSTTTTTTTSTNSHSPSSSAYPRPSSRSSGSTSSPSFMSRSTYSSCRRCSTNASRLPPFSALSAIMTWTRHSLLLIASRLPFCLSELHSTTLSRIDPTISQLSFERQSRLILIIFFKLLPCFISLSRASLSSFWVFVSFVSGFII